METIETFVTLSVHEGTNAEGKAVKFIRARFQVDTDTYLTAFNPKGINRLELVKRVSQATGKVRIQTRWPVLVRFQRDTVVGSDVVAKCEIEPRAFVATAMQSADAADLAALAALDRAQPTAQPATPAPQAPQAPQATEEPLA